MRNNTLLFVTRRDPLDQTTRSMVSQLLELGICFEFDEKQKLPSEIPSNLDDYPAVLIDDFMLDDVDEAQLDRYARGGGHVWRLEEPMASDEGDKREGLGLYGRSLLDFITQNRAHVLAFHSNLRSDRSRLLQMQMRQTPESQMPRIAETVEPWLDRLNKFEEKTYQYWSVARTLIENGYDHLLPSLRKSMDRAIAVDRLPFHGDGIGGLHIVFWLAQRDGREDWLNRARALAEEFCKRRPRNGSVLANTGYNDDPLGLTADAPAAFRLLVSSYPAIFWTESMRTNASLMAAMAGLTGERRYFKEAEAYVARLEVAHMRPDGLLAHCSRDASPAAPDAPVWARGVAHACDGLLSMLEALPDDAPLRTRVQKLLERIARGLIPHQDQESGLWRNVIDHPEARLETSGSVSLAYVLYTGLDQGWLDEETFAPVAERLFEGLWQTYWHGGLGAWCRGTASSQDVVYYLARPQGWNAAPYLPPAMVMRQRWQAGASR